MIKHIVFWNLKDVSSYGDKDFNARSIKQKLESLQGKIEGLIKIEVGIDFLHSPESMDLVLYSEFTDKAALDFYQLHPLHKEIMPFIAEARSERRVVDYEF